MTRRAAIAAPAALALPAPSAPSSTLLGRTRAEESRVLVPPQQKAHVERIAQAVRQFRELETKREWIGRRWPLLADIGAQMQPPLSAKQLRRYINRFERALKAKQNPEAALCRVSRKGQGEFFRRHPEAAAFAQHKYFGERVGSYRLVYESLRRQFPNLAVHADTVRRFLRAHPRPFKTLALQGPRAWRSEDAPHLQRTRPLPGEWFVMDGRRLDVDSMNTISPELRPGAMYRVEITAARDWGSGAWVGYCFAPHSNSRTIMSAARMALADWGFPLHFLWDNGEDYKKVQRVLEGTDLGGEFGAALGNFLKDNGVEFGITRALPYRPSSKPIESSFSTMSRRFDCIFGDAYQGNSTARRTEYNEAAQKRHGKWLAGKAPHSPLPTDVEGIGACIAWMRRENNRPRKYLGGLTPLQALEEKHPPHARRMAGPGLLNMLLAERDLRTVQKGGCVQLDNRRYEPTESSLAALSDLKGSEVIVLRDPYSLENAVALDPQEMAFVGELQIQEFVAQCPNGHITRDAIKANERRVAFLRNRFTGYLAWLAVIAERQGWKSERTILLQEAGFATGTDGRALPPAAIPGAGVRKALPAPAPPQCAEDFVAGFLKDEG